MATVADKRLIIRHPSGLRRICGTVQPGLTPSDLRSLPEVVSGEATLERVEKRYVMYRERVKVETVEDGA
jgi:hypothetical protein